MAETELPALSAQPEEAMAVATAAPVEVAAPEALAPPPWFSEFASEKGVQEFANLLSTAGLTAFVESCETPLTIFAPTNEAIRQLGRQIPSDTQLLRELLCVHITMGSLWYAARRKCEEPPFHSWREPRPPATVAA
jgi:uncharacterized surface protein with fasciclin (FAS1) repeats